MSFLRELYLPLRFFLVLLGEVLAFVLAFIFPQIYPVVVWSLVLFGLLWVTDLFLLFGTGKGVEAERKMTDKLSNGDGNPVEILFYNHYPFPLRVRLIDEIPPQFQKRDLVLNFGILPGERKVLSYMLRPVCRGEYEFGKIRAFVSTFLLLAERRYSIGEKRKVAVYPSFISMRKYELMALGNRRQEGVKKIHAVNISSSFDQIKPYVWGDDPRTVNWKATARSNRLMVNSYLEERSQPVYCLIDEGRTMQSAFREMTLLDYAINAALALSDIVLKKGDYAGLYTFSNVPGAFVKADNRGSQLNRINEVLYNRHTHFRETDFEQLYVHSGRWISSRSLFILFTNFDSENGMKRHLAALRRLAEKHLLLVVLFEDTEIREVLKGTPKSLKDIYFHTLAADFIMEKKRICAELKRSQINAILCRPEELTADVINTYLELKERNAI